MAPRLFTLQNVVSAIAIVVALGGAFGSYTLIEYRVEQLENRVVNLNEQLVKETDQLQDAATASRSVLHRRVTKNSEDLQAHREEAISQLGSIDTKIGRIDGKLETLLQRNTP